MRKVLRGCLQSFANPDGKFTLLINKGIDSVKTFEANTWKDKEAEDIQRATDTKQMDIYFFFFNQTLSFSVSGKN